LTVQNAITDLQTLPQRSLADDLRSAFAHPRDAWRSLRRWVLLARYANVSYGEIVRFRRELRNDHAFQEHLKLCLKEIRYIFPEAAELYVLVRAMKPRTIVETGVASGLSSAHMLRALAANGGGMLYSIDLPNVQEGSVLPNGRTSGWIVPDSLRGRWKLQLGDSRKLLPELLRSLDGVDIFLHDSDHSYESMLFEFEQAFPTLEHGGLLLSDDVHLHSAWKDFCAKHNLRPTYINHLGVTRKP